MPKAAAVLDDDCLHDDDNNALFLRVSEARGWLALAVGDPAQALAEAAHIGRQEGGVPWVGHPGLMSWRPIAALALARIDRRNEAVEYAADEVQRARDVGAARSLAAALRVRGQLEGRGGVTMLEEAVAVAEQSSSLLERAACAIELGAALRRTNRRAAALDVLRSGLDLAYRCEAHPIADRARHEIAVCGGRPRRTALTGPSALTPSEVRVAQLAASGMTNREIAEHLVVSLKAVEWHLRNTFAKLDITTRRDLAAALHESKVAEDTA
jgi:DNA-binding CsgD family transcriptional regulator